MLRNKEYIEQEEEYAHTVPHSLYYEDKSRFRRWLNRRRWEIVMEACGELEGKRLLEVGCGDGYILERFNHNLTAKPQRGKEKLFAIHRSPFAIVGIDVSITRCKRARVRAPYASISMQDGYRLAFADNVFDVVICCDVLEHLDDPELACKEILRVTKANGEILLMIPNDISCTIAKLITYNKPFINPDHKHLLIPRTLDRFMERGPISTMSIPGLSYWTSLHYLARYRK